MRESGVRYRSSLLALPIEKQVELHFSSPINVSALQTKIVSSLKVLYQYHPNAQFDISWDDLRGDMTMKEFVIRYFLLLEAYWKTLYDFGEKGDVVFENLKVSYYIHLYMPPSHWQGMLHFHKTIRRPSLESVSFQYEDVMETIHKLLNRQLDEINAELDAWEEEERMHSSPSGSRNPRQAPPGVVRPSEQANNITQTTTEEEVPDTPSMPGSSNQTVKFTTIQRRSLGTDEEWQDPHDPEMPPLVRNLIHWRRDRLLR